MGGEDDFPHSAEETVNHSRAIRDSEVSAQSRTKGTLLGQDLGFVCP